jgi:hypothetical protein
MTINGTTPTLPVSSRTVTDRPGPGQPHSRLVPSVREPSQLHQSRPLRRPFPVHQRSRAQLDMSAMTIIMTEECCVLLSHTTHYSSPHIRVPCGAQYGAISIRHVRQMASAPIFECRVANTVCQSIRFDPYANTRFERQSFLNWHSEKQDRCTPPPPSPCLLT